MGTRQPSSGCPDGNGYEIQAFLILLPFIVGMATNKMQELIFYKAALSGGLEYQQGLLDSPSSNMMHLDICRSLLPRRREHHPI